jgi:hypothetical protein
LPVQPIPCGPDGGGTPGDPAACYSPAITTTPLCREDGTTILLVVSSPAADCGDDAAPPEVTGWIDPATGVFTPGAAPADAGPCETPGCVETVCRTLCDDTDGDGAADATYSELWCVRADGTTSLVLTYQGDPSTPYVPVSPVECEWGSQETETLQLCDDSGPFLRRYTWLQGVATFLDYALDGATPHIVTGPVRTCSTGCDAAPVATVGLCLADGTPIAVLLTRDCDGAVTRQGWVQLLTGTYSEGAPPAGARPCGDASAFELTGILCDTDPATGDVLGLVLVEYAYAPDGSLASVQLLNPATGDPYTLQGVLRQCPGGGDQLPEQDSVVLCDVQADGTTTAFVRDYRRDAAGLITGHTDYTLDGGTYAVTGTVGVCQPEQPAPTPPPVDVESYGLCVIDNATGDVLQEIRREVVYDAAGLAVGNRFVDAVTGAPVAVPGGAHLGVCPAPPCRNTSTLLVCDLPQDGTPAATLTDTSGAPYYPYTTGVPTPGAQALWDGGTLTLPDATGPQPGTGGTVRTAAATIQAPRPACDTGTAHVTVQVNVTQLGPDNGCRNTGFIGIYNGSGEANRVALALAPLDTPAGWSGTLTAEADVPAADLAAGNIAVLAAFDAYDDSGATCPPPRRTGWELSAFTTTVAYDQAGCAAQVFANVVTDCETGAVESVTYTLPDGTAYAPTGAIGQCAPASSGTTVPPCGDTELVQLCDLTYDPQAPIPTPARDFTLTGNVVTGNQGTTLWFAQANQPATGVAELTVGGLLATVLYDYRFATAWIGAGGSNPAANDAVYLLEILDGTTVLATRTQNTSNGSSVFPGGVLAEEPPLSFIAPATGTVTIRWTDLTTGGAINDRDLFVMPIELRTSVLTVTASPFLRRMVFDCDGGLTSAEDFALDGSTPYVVEGEVGQCTSGDGGGSTVAPPSPGTSTLLLCDTTATGPVQFLRTLTVDAETGDVLTTADTTLDGDPYDVTGEVGQCAPAEEPCPAHTVLSACRCDDTDGDGIADVEYVELLAVDCAGVLTSVGTYTEDLTQPYAPVSPVDCATVEAGAPLPVTVQAHRVQLPVGGTWDASTVVALRSATFTAHTGTGQITTVEGASTLFRGESVTWSTDKEQDAALVGPLSVTAVDGIVTVAFTTGS